MRGRSRMAVATAARWLGAAALCGMLSGLAAGSAQADEPTWAERLGYPEGKRVLLLHCDDTGMCFEANDAARRYFADGGVRSASAMVPCPWFDEFWGWYAEHPDSDVGLHLTLTSEWEWYRWGPVAPADQVPGLVGPNGYMWKTVLAVASRASAEEVETELRAQIERALARGPRPGHLDTHMGTVYARLDYLQVYLDLAVEYRIPAMVIEPTPEVISHFVGEGYPLTQATVDAMKAYPLPKLDRFFPVPKADSYPDLVARTKDLVRSLPRGMLSEIIFHPSTSSPALRRITSSWRQRVWEAQLFRDPDMKAFLEAEGCVVTDWKEIMRRFDARAAEPEGPTPPAMPNEPEPEGPAPPQSSNEGSE